MTRSVLKTGILATGVTALVLVTFTSVAPADPQQQAREILQATGVQGGLVVHLGCGDGQLTAALHATDSYLVQGLATDREQVTAARARLQDQGLYGPVSIDRIAGGQLPYIDNTVNLVVAEDLDEVPMDEVLRVLCPEGVAYVKQSGRWTKTVKPRPQAIDEWTHFMHDAGGNAVAHDTVVAPPRRLQWLGSPRWSRHHDHMSSVSACVSSGGRLFYIFDEAPRISILTPPDWQLIARDAFNGTVLRNHGSPQGLQLVEGKFGKAIKLSGKAPPRKAGGNRASQAPFVHRWASDVPMIVRGLVMAGKTLFLIGPPDLIDEEAVSGRATPDIVAQLEAQDEAWRGKDGSLMWAMSADTGEKLAEYNIDALPVFDSMAAANERLYFATTDGTVHCYAPK